MTTAIGIDVGGTNAKGVLLSASGEVLARAVRATEDFPSRGDSGGKRWQEGVNQMVQELKAQNTKVLGAIGLAAPGLPNETNTAIRLMPGRLSGLENLVWADFLGEREVWVLNDAHAALMAEAKFGVGLGVKNVVMLTLGTGVGGGILIDGSLYQGNYQMAGHIGHMTLNADREEIDVTNYFIKH